MEWDNKMAEQCEERQRKTKHDMGARSPVKRDLKDQNIVNELDMDRRL